MKTKTLVIRSISIKEEVKYTVLIKKDISKVKKKITPMDFAVHLRKLDVSENSKVSYGRIFWNWLYEKYCYVSKSRWNVQHPEVH